MYTNQSTALTAVRTRQPFWKHHESTTVFYILINNLIGFS